MVISQSEIFIFKRNETKPQKNCTIKKFREIPQNSVLYRTIRFRGFDLTDGG